MEKMCILDQYVLLDQKFQKVIKKFNKKFFKDNAYEILKKHSWNIYIKFSTEFLETRLSQNVNLNFKPYIVGDLSIAYSKRLEDLNNINIYDLDKKQMKDFEYVAGIYKITQELVFENLFYFLDTKAKFQELNKSQEKIYNYYKYIVNFFLEETNDLTKSLEKNIENIKRKRLILNNY